MTRDELLARAKARGYDDAQAAELVDAYLAKKTATTPVKTGPAKTAKAPKPAPKVDAAKKPAPPKPSPAATAQTPASPRGGSTVYGPVAPPKTEPPKAGPTIQNAPPAPGIASRERVDAYEAAADRRMAERVATDPVLNILARGVPVRTTPDPSLADQYEAELTRQGVRRTEPRTFTARDYMGASSPAPASKSDPRPPSAAERYMAGGGVADLRRADDAKGPTVDEMRAALAAQRPDLTTLLGKATDEQVRQTYAKRAAGGR